jgi:Flp pilus assembly protein TadD/predicted nuclease with TOPRIM domain
VKHRSKWSELTEYTLLAGTGVGTLVAVLTQQFLYAASPLSLYLLLNLMNRRRADQRTLESADAAISQVDRKLTENIDLLQQQTKSLPSFLDLATLRKTVLQENEAAIARLQQETAEKFSQFEAQNLGAVQQDLHQLHEQYNQIGASISTITTNLKGLADNTRVGQLEETVTQLTTEVSQLREDLQRLTDEQRSSNTRTLQDQINHLNRRINSLPQPFDASALKQDIDSLLKVSSDMVSRRELARLASQIEKLHQQQQTLEQTVVPTRVASAILRKRLDGIATKLNAQTPEQPLYPQTVADDIDELRQTVQTLEDRLSQIPKTDADLKDELQTVAETHLDKLQQQLQTVQQFTQTLEQQQQTLRQYVDRLPQLLDFKALQNQLRFLAQRIDGTESGLTNVQRWVEENVQSRIEDINQQIQTLHPPSSYGLVLDFKPPADIDQPGSGKLHASRAVLEEALDVAEGRLVVVWSHPDQGTINEELMQKFKAFLDRKGCLDIGWGHLQDAYSDRSPRFIHQRWSNNSTVKTFLQDSLNQLAQLKKDYPGQFRFKVLGTNENFLVCDRTFAILGIHPIAESNQDFPEVGVGLRTTDTQIIQQLINRFDNPLLDPQDASAYFNRAATRFELGDKAGAVHDYTRVLQIDPQDDLAYNNRGVAQFELGEKQAALQDFERSLRLNQNQVAAYCNRGTIRSDTGDKLGAIEDYCYAIQADPDCAIAYFYRGLERSRLGNKLGAMHDYSEVIRIEPQNPNAYLYRGLAAIKLGQNQAALVDLNQAAILFANQGDRTNHQQTLKTIARLQKALEAELSRSLIAH